MVAHYVLSTIFAAPANRESTFITVLILFFLFDPSLQIKNLGLLALVAVIAVASKYILAWRKLHIINPVVIAAVCASLFGLLYATWWIANPWMFIPVVIGGLVITYKIRRFALVTATIIGGLAVFGFLGLVTEQLSLDMLRTFLVAWPIVFFATVMVTEPLATPAGKHNHIMYGLFVGVLSSTPFMFGPLYSSPEMALLIGNIVFYYTTIRGRLTLSLIERKLIAKDTWEFTFKPNFPIWFKAGQYLEWTVPHNKTDKRGIRRYFTIASSPTEDSVRVGLKLQENGSSFKKNLYDMQVGDNIFATSLDGDFTLVKNTKKPLVFIAGGIGVTPFASMTQYMIDTKQKRDVTMFYCNNTQSDIAWQNLWDTANQSFGMNTYHVLNKPEDKWDGFRGYISAQIIQDSNIDIQQSQFYISGPPVMVSACKKMLLSVGVSRKNITTDFFPGLA